MWRSIKHREKAQHPLTQEMICFVFDQRLRVGSCDETGKMINWFSTNAPIMH